jgi:hypothetical protein
MVATMGWKSALAYAAMICAVPLLLDQTLVREVYFRFLEPRSTAGTVLLARRVADAQYIAGKKNVLVIGDSRAGEDFSPELANAVDPGAGVNFVGLGLPGTSPRVWYYVLRDIDPDRKRYAAVWMATDSLRDDQVYSEPVNRGLDSAYLAPLLRLSDIWTYPMSFSDPKLRWQAVWNILFVGGTLQDDMRAFARHPLDRIREVHLWEKAYPDWVRAYQGRTGTVPTPEELPAAATTGSRQQRQAALELAGYLQRVKNNAYIPRSVGFAYHEEWFGAIARAYSGTRVQLGLLLIPRGPYREQYPGEIAPEGSVADLARSGLIKLAPASLVTGLERPKFFFDRLHLNRAGRIEFSKRFARWYIESADDPPAAN